MGALSFAALFGLVALVCGIFLVNVISTPRSTQIGTIIAFIGVLSLAIFAVGQLLY